MQGNHKDFALCSVCSFVFWRMVDAAPQLGWAVTIFSSRRSHLFWFDLLPMYMEGEQVGDKSSSAGQWIELWVIPHALVWSLDLQMENGMNIAPVSAMNAWLGAVCETNV